MKLPKFIYRTGMVLGFIAFLIGLACAQDVSQAGSAGVKIGDKAPDFSLKDLDGKTVRLSDFADKQPVLMMLFSTY